MLVVVVVVVVSSLNSREMSKVLSRFCTQHGIEVNSNGIPDMICTTCKPKQDEQA